MVMFLEFPSMRPSPEMRSPARGKIKLVSLNAHLHSTTSSSLLSWRSTVIDSALLIFFPLKAEQSANVVALEIDVGKVKKELYLLPAVDALFAGPLTRSYQLVPFFGLGTLH